MSVYHIDDSMEKAGCRISKKWNDKAFLPAVEHPGWISLCIFLIGQCRCNLGKWGEVSASRGSGSSYWRTAADISPSKGLFGPSQAKRPQSEHFYLKRKLFFRFRLDAVKIMKEAWLSWKQRAQTAWNSYLKFYQEQHIISSFTRTSKMMWWPMWWCAVKPWWWWGWWPMMGG